MRVIAFPKKGISYNDCFYAAVEAQRVEVVEGVFSGVWLQTNVRHGDWIHLHWPSFAYNMPGTKLMQIIWFARFIGLLLLIRAKGAGLVWTAHNLLPHDRCQIPFLDILGRHLVIRLSNIILVHGPSPAATLEKRFPSAGGKIVLIPHGHWVGYYPVTMSREDARLRLGISLDITLFLFIGLCKPYKNLHELIKTFHTSNLDAKLIIAGKFQDPIYLKHNLSLADNDPRIQIIEGFIPDESMQLYLKACDYVVVPYREILTSGTAMLALSFGRPLISVNIGFLRDVIADDIGILYAHEDPNGLAMALSEAMHRKFCEKVIIDHARQYSFTEAAQIFIESLQTGKP